MAISEILGASLNEAKNFVVDKNNETKNFAMITEDKDTEIFCIADDFCKFYDAMMAKNTIKAALSGHTTVTGRFPRQKSCLSTVS